jgi:hypothetical protein
VAFSSIRALRGGVGADVNEHVAGGAEFCSDRLHAVCTKLRWA